MSSGAQGVVGADGRTAGLFRTKRVFVTATDTPLAEPRPVSVVLQNENGPCPLLAAANVVALRGTISLPGAAHGFLTTEVCTWIHALLELLMFCTPYVLDARRLLVLLRLTSTCPLSLSLSLSRAFVFVCAMREYLSSLSGRIDAR